MCQPVRVVTVVTGGGMRTVDNEYAPICAISFPRHVTCDNISHGTPSFLRKENYRTIWTMICSASIKAYQFFQPRWGNSITKLQRPNNELRTRVESCSSSSSSSFVYIKKRNSSFFSSSPTRKPHPLIYKSPRTDDPSTNILEKRITQPPSSSGSFSVFALAR